MDRVTLTDLLAGVGAASGVLALFLHWYLWRRSGSDLRVELSLRNQRPDSTTHAVRLTSFNRGRLPTTVTGLGLEFDGKTLERLMPSDGRGDWPRVLELQGEVHTDVLLDTLALQHGRGGPVSVRGWAEQGGGTRRYSRRLRIHLPEPQRPRFD